VKLRLNLACGDDYREGFENLDYRTDCGADRYADVGVRLPYFPETVELIVAQDCLEHIPFTRTKAVLAEWRRVLVPEGELRVRVPHMRFWAEAILGQHPELSMFQIMEHIYGRHRWGPDGLWDAHQAGWTPESMRAELDEAGFQVVYQDNNPDFYTYGIKR